MMNDTAPSGLSNQDATAPQGFTSLRPGLRVLRAFGILALLILSVSCKPSRSIIPPPNYGVHRISIDSSERTNVYLKRFNRVSFEKTISVRLDGTGTRWDTTWWETRYYLQPDRSIVAVTKWYYGGIDTGVYDAYDRGRSGVSSSGGHNTIDYDDVVQVITQTSYSNSKYDVSTHKMAGPLYANTEIFRFGANFNLVEHQTQDNGHRFVSITYEYDPSGHLKQTIGTRYRRSGDSANCCDSSVEHLEHDFHFYDADKGLQGDSIFYWKDSQWEFIATNTFDEKNRIESWQGARGGSPMRHYRDEYGRTIRDESFGIVDSVSFNEKGLETGSVRFKPGGKTFDWSKTTYEYNLGKP